MNKKRFTTREKLELMKQIDERNEQRWKEFVKKKRHNENPLTLYLEGRITKEEMYRRINTPCPLRISRKR